jgi:hypothetical protein
MLSIRWMLGIRSTLSIRRMQFACFTRLRLPGDRGLVLIRPGQQLAHALARLCGGYWIIRRGVFGERVLLRFSHFSSSQSRT